MSKLWIEYKKGYFIRWDNEALCFIGMHPTRKIYSQGITPELCLMSTKDAVRLARKRKEPNAKRR